MAETGIAGELAGLRKEAIEARLNPHRVNRDHLGNLTLTIKIKKNGSEEAQDRVIRKIRETIAKAVYSKERHPESLMHLIHTTQVHGPARYVITLPEYQTNAKSITDLEYVLKRHMTPNLVSRAVSTARQARIGRVFRSR